PRADPVAVPRRDLDALRVRLMIEALVPGAHVAEDRRLLEPVGERRRLLHLGGRRLRLLGILLDLLLRRLPDGALLLDLTPKPLDLVLGLVELLLEGPKPLLDGSLGVGGNN